MKKILTRIETSVGYETYRLVIETENSVSYSSTFYIVRDVMIISVDIVKSSSSLSDGPFKKGFYDLLRFPMDKTILSEQSLDYGDVKTTEE